MTNLVVPYSLDEYFSSTPIGSVDRAAGNNLYGINHQQTPGLVQSNKDTYGLTFFTRPQLNLQPDNIRNERRFYPLLSNNSVSIQRYIRCMLDPRMDRGHDTGSGTVNTLYPALPCPLVDSKQAFIPVLTNNLLTLSGWPDITAPVFESDSGLYKETYIQVDGIAKNYESFDLDATFRNTKGDPIIYMFYIWLHYMSNVFEGKLVPYMDYLVENIIDYNTRIYRLVLDADKDKVKKIACTGASLPISVPTGSFFDFNSETPYSDQNKEISIRFRCMGADYLDDILIREFNQTVSIFNPFMKDKYRDKTMQMIDKSLLPLFNNRGYARINEFNYSLEWWVDKSLFNAVISGTHPDLMSFYPSTVSADDSLRKAAIDEVESTSQSAAKDADSKIKSKYGDKTQEEINEYNNTRE